jgi:hypothetical protein
LFQFANPIGGVKAAPLFMLRAGAEKIAKAIVMCSILKYLKSKANKARGF